MLFLCFCDIMKVAYSQIKWHTKLFKKHQISEKSLSDGKSTPKLYLNSSHTAMLRKRMGADRQTVRDMSDTLESYK